MARERTVAESVISVDTGTLGKDKQGDATIINLNAEYKLEKKL